MVFAAMVAVYDNGSPEPHPPSSAASVGKLIASHADVAIEHLAEGWRGTFITSLPLQLGGHYWIETAGKAFSQITVTAASQSESSFEGVGPSPF